MDDYWNCHRLKLNIVNTIIYKAIIYTLFGVQHSRKLVNNAIGMNTKLCIFCMTAICIHLRAKLADRSATVRGKTKHKLSHLEVEHFTRVSLPDFLLTREIK